MTTGSTGSEVQGAIFIKDEYGLTDIDLEVAYIPLVPFIMEEASA